MNAFVAVAVLVVAVGAQQEFLKIGKFQQQQLLPTTLSGQVGQEGKLLRELPTFRQDFSIENIPTLSIEELYQTELFREYLAIPLFRQFWQYPVFQDYVASPLFQNLWFIREFQQYFRNPVLFYKHIYPQLQITQQAPRTPLEYTTEVTGPTNYNRDYVRPIYRPNVDYNALRRRVEEGSLPIALQQPFYQTPASFPGQRQVNYDYDLNNNPNYKILLNKIVRSLFNEKNSEATGADYVVTKPTTHIEVPTEAKTDKPAGEEKQKTTGNTEIIEEKLPKQPARELAVPKKEGVDPAVDEKLIKDPSIKKQQFPKVSTGKKILTTEELKNIIPNLPLTVEEEYRMRRNPSVAQPFQPFTFENENVFSYNPILHRVPPNGYNSEYYQHPSVEEGSVKEFLPFIPEDHLNVYRNYYNTLINKNAYHKDLPRSQLSRVPLTYEPFQINSGLTTFNPEHGKDVKA